MQTPQWVVSEFDQEGNLVAEYPLRNITVGDLRRVFEQEDEADMIESWPLTERIARELAPFLDLSFQIHPDRSYYVECFSDEQ